jgi:beta-phosphoglucomutase-like phosphatase (HAD superfamily)
MLKNISAVIFDMDGVIIDSEPIHFKLERQMFEDLGFSLTTEEHESFLGTNGFEMFNRLKARFGFTDPVETLVEEERTRYLRELESGRIPARSRCHGAHRRIIRGRCSSGRRLIGPP